MLLELDAIHDKVGITFIYVTHDQQEALSVSDRVAVLNAGTIHQVGTPFEIYEQPADTFVANFIGETNFFTGKVRQPVDAGHVVVGVDSIGSLLVDTDKKVLSGNAVAVSVRPEKIKIGTDVPACSGGHVNMLTGSVEDIIYSGFQSKYFVNVNGTMVRVFKQHINYQPDEKPVSWKDTVYISWNAADGIIVEICDK
jgi:spermidine/putrescine transport system ATP-binding protein